MFCVKIINYTVLKIICEHTIATAACVQCKQATFNKIMNNIKTLCLHAYT